MRDPFKPSPSAKSSRQQAAASNPLARAMAETEKRAYSSPKSSDSKDSNNLLSEAMARTGGNFAGDQNQVGKDASNQLSQQDMERQQEEAKRKQKHEAMRKKLHEQINPIDMKDVFDAKEQQVLKKLEETRKEIKSLLIDIKTMAASYDIEATKITVSPGREGSGAVNYWDQFLNFIRLLRKQIKSANTWMKQQQAKSKKKGKGKGSKKPGLEVGGGAKHEQGKNIFDQMHHERSSSYSGN